MSLRPDHALLIALLALACGEPRGGSGGPGSGGFGGGEGGSSGGGGTPSEGGSGGEPGRPTLLGNGRPVELVTVADAGDGLNLPRDLGFHPDRSGELWIVNRADDSVTIVFDATGAAQRTEHRIDGYALHFMEEVSSIAMGARNFQNDRSFGTCQESRNTYDHHEQPNDFMGPALWSANLSVFAVANPIGLGSHIDMLHHSPFCMGIAHERDNVYWVFDGLHGQIVRYDFLQDHDAGYDDHSDGVIRFLDEPKVKRHPDIPSHMVIDPATKKLYVADASAGRVLRIDTTSGAVSRSLEPIEPGTTVEAWSGITWSELVAPGRVQIPSGIALHEGIVYVGDNATGVIHAFDLDGMPLDALGTGVRDLMGLEPGPDGRLYLVDARENRVIRIENH